MQKTIKSRGILPPDIEKKSKIVYGIMWIRVGRLNVQTTPTKSKSEKRYRVQIQFWGDRQPVCLQPQNTTNPTLPKLHEYEIRCPILNFQKYLLDMKNNLKIEVLEQAGTAIGLVPIDFNSLLNPNANHTSKSAFDHFRSHFPILHKGKKLGTLEIEMASNFNPRILEVEMEQKQLECRNAIDLLAVNDPKKLEEFLQEYDRQEALAVKETDHRVPNSLVTKGREDAEFDQRKYQDQESKQPQHLPQKQIKQVVEQQQQTFEPLTKKPSFPQRIKIQHEPSAPSSSQEFPNLEKILTYSNLKLNEPEITEPPILQRSAQLAKPDNGEDQIRKNRELRKEFYGDSPHSSIIDIIDSVPKSVQQQPKTIQVVPQKITQAQQKPHIVQANPTPLLAPPIIPRPIYMPSPSVPNPTPSPTLTLYIQLHSPSLNIPVPFHLFYRSYGQHDRTRLAPSSTISLLSPVGATEMKHMDKVPFIIEFWDTRKNAFIGVMKIGLHKIKQGFLVGGKEVNWWAVRVNVEPTVLFRGELPIQDLKGVNAGKGYVKVMIGTATQVNTYINEKGAEKEQKSVQVETKEVAPAQPIRQPQLPLIQLPPQPVQQPQPQIAPIIQPASPIRQPPQPQEFKQTFKKPKPTIQIAPLPLSESIPGTPTPYKPREEQSPPVLPNHSFHSENLQQNKQISNLGSLVKQVLDLKDDPIQQPQPRQPQPLPTSPSPARPTRFRHSFTLQPVELTLQSALSGDCSISYRFPHEQQQIQSKSLNLFADKYKYEVRMVGKHAVVLPEDETLEGYIADELIRFRVIVNGEDQAEAALPAEEFIIAENTEEVKILALFSTASEDPYIVGKLKIKIGYKKQPSNEDFIGKQTTINLYLPKNGSLNIDITTAVDMPKLARQLHLKSDFYCSLQFSLFPQSKQLLQSFKPLHSKLSSSMTSSTLSLRESVRLKLTPATIQYLKSKPCRITLQAVHYQKIEGVLKKQEVVLGAIEIPLLSVVTGRGIKGEYAFKNRYGIFVGLADCAVSYGRRGRERDRELPPHDIRRDSPRPHKRPIVQPENSSNIANSMLESRPSKSKYYQQEQDEIREDEEDPQQNEQPQPQSSDFKEQPYESNISANYDRIARILKEDIKVGREMLFESSEDEEEY